MKNFLFSLDWIRRETYRRKSAGAGEQGTRRARKDTDGNESREREHVCLETQGNIIWNVEIVGFIVPSLFGSQQIFMRKYKATVLTFSQRFGILPFYSIRIPQLVSWMRH